MPKTLSRAPPVREWVCSFCRLAAPNRSNTRAGLLRGRPLHTEASSSPAIPFRKQFKEERKRKRALGLQESMNEGRHARDKLADWELTVGIEVHAQLSTERKLFSCATTSSTDQPNTHTALFDLATPGSQPDFQKATLLPALRAALALNCSIQRRSTFDRKHYFYQDQPAGYQITQYYSPFAKDGFITLDKHDGIAAEDGEYVKVGIKQIQMEQDTAKTIVQPPDGCLLDFNRVGHPLIEIITLPHIHHPQTAAACVRKIQQVLQAVSSVTTGMELGGLRADVNVSVRAIKGPLGKHSYHGVAGLGQRTEIKNLSSFKAVEDAIVAERDRQIAVLDAGGVVEGETRGWTLGSTETRKLRGKEGEVDYRYMPDPDLPAVIIGQDLIKHLSVSLPMLPDEQTRLLIDRFGLTMKDAKTLVALEGGLRLDYFQEVLASLLQKEPNSHSDEKELGRMVGNWVIHELGGLLSTSAQPFHPTVVPASSLASILHNLLLTENNISRQSAKLLLARLFDDSSLEIDKIIDAEGVRIQSYSEEQYRSLARDVLAANPEMVGKLSGDGRGGKLQWFVGQMVREGKGRVDALKASRALREVLGLPV